MSSPQNTDWIETEDLIIGDDLPPELTLVRLEDLATVRPTRKIRSSGCWCCRLRGWVSRLGRPLWMAKPACRPAKGKNWRNELREHPTWRIRSKLVFTIARWLGVPITYS